MEIKSVGVLGAGTMGNGIAHVFARSGFQVLLCDVKQELVDRAVATITKNLEREHAKQRLTPVEVKDALARIRTTTAVGELAAAQFVVEAATEKLEIKSELLRALDRALAADVVLASNTSSISITKLAALTGRPDRVIGMHFFNPVPVMKLVEIIRGLQTSQSTFEVV